MADENSDDSGQEQFDLAHRLSAHGVALAGQAPTQVATALEVQSVLGSAVHYVKLNGAGSAERHHLLSLCRGLGIEVRSSAQTTSGTQDLEIQPCRLSQCNLPVHDVSSLLTLLAGE